MSEVLARIRVKEEHGIRRFLYPLATHVDLAANLDYEALGIATSDYDLDKSRLNLTTEDGQPLPLYVSYVSHKDEQEIETGCRLRLDYAAFLAPGEEQVLSLVTATTPSPPISDPLIIAGSGLGYRSEQERFQIEFGGFSLISNVIYDDLVHLRGPLTVRRNGAELPIKGRSSAFRTPITASAGVSGWSDDPNGPWITRVDVTAAKSWATVSHSFMGPKAGDRFTFALPFAANANLVTCDFGIGGGTFGKLQKGSAEEIVWQTKLEEDTAYWSLATAGRTDYVGQTPLQDFRSQRWFHLIDSDKALAVAITEVPDACREMAVTLNITGDVVITFQLGEPTDAVEFGVCYHFLNDIPAIAAATNPQSILLPPTVEVLPV